MEIDATKLGKEITGKYTVVSNSFACVSKTDPKDKIEVVVGDDKQVDFYPQVKLMRWDNEVNFSARLIPDSLRAAIKGKPKVITPTISTVSDKIVHDNGNITSHFYELPTSEDLPEGGYEFEITLKEKPATNVVSFSLQTKGLEFFYQPELTQEEIDDGCRRPENVIGSYVIYYKDCPTNFVGGKEYKSGQMGIIYRPRIEDFEKNWVYGELNISNGLMTVTIPQEFLDKATYPIKHVGGSTFGYGTVGSSSKRPTYNKIYTCTATYAGSAGTGDSMSVYAEKYSNTLTQMGLYNGTAFVGRTSSVTVNNTARWWSANFTSSPSLDTSNYSLCFLPSNSSYFYYNTGATQLYASATLDNWPNPITLDGMGDIRWSIYVTYTAGASGPANMKSYNTNLKANIKSINTNLIANVKSLNTNV